jgi:hypothetical protein
MPRKGRFYVKQSVSFPPDMLAAARRRARNLGLAFSAYFQKCLERDLARRGAVIFIELDRAAPMAADLPQSGIDHARPRVRRR